MNMEENMNQMPPKAPQAPVAENNPQNVFKIILYVLLGLSILGGFLNFIGSFSYFGGWISDPLLGIGQLFSSLAVMAISIILIIRMSKNEKFGFLAVAFFALAFLLNFIGIILIGGLSFGALGLIINLGGLAIAVLACIPMNKIGDVNSYKDLLKEAQPIDYILLGAYAVFTLLTLIACLKWAKLARGLGAL
ncbi:MAG: hypothetical protein IK092_03685 [Muribaculaceae bacterium]|nr:hypothetical protein [Muribaculaceae bacterium]